MLAELGSVLGLIGTWFAAVGGQSSFGLKQRPLREWALRLALVALFFGVIACIWSVCLSAALKP